ncbi:hypothetical protein DFH09DRAFT_1120062 [Mycena vulgaris]|nr:hypothetical protein DFH09DRAFT_1120062 [Mycena vulgaris]
MRRSILVPLIISALRLVSTQPAQHPFEVDPAQFDNHHHEPGFDLDLNALRLVQFSLGQEAVWMTEREKLVAKARGDGYLDITNTQALGWKPDSPEFQ